LQIANQKNDTTKRGQSLRHLNVLGTLYQTLDGGLSPMVARMYNEVAKELGLEERWDETVERPFTPKEQADLARAEHLARKTLELTESFERRMAKLTSETGLNNKKAEFWATRTFYYPEELQLKIDDHLRKVNEGFYKNEFDYDKLNQNVAEADAKAKRDLIVKKRDDLVSGQKKAEEEYYDLLNKLRTDDPEKEGRIRTYEQLTDGEKAQLSYAQSKISSYTWKIVEAEAEVVNNPLDKLIEEAKAIYRQESEAQQSYKEMIKDGKKFVSTPGNINYQLNVPYGYGEESSKSADCSGLVCMAFNNAGLNIGRPTANSLASHPSFGSVYNTFRKTDVAKQQTNFKNIIAGLQPNDLILIDWEGTGKKFDHVVAFVGNNAIVHAPRTGTYSQKVEASKYLESMKGNPSIKVIRHKKLGGARVAT
jgi:cell wall-associated NlpC family hydrolase